MTIQYISTNESLQQLAESLNRQSAFAIDLEFDRNRYRYGFNICLMQIFDGENCYLVDPLSKDLDISLIFPPIENPKVEKVVFAFGEDLRLLHSMGCFPKNLYDLDVATSLLNYEPASLTNLIQKVLNVEVNSSSQQSNWYKRPLTENQKLYAADDVLYLLDFKKAIEEKVKEREMEEWIAQENAIFDALDYSDEDHKNLLKDKDKEDMSMYEWHIYSRLMEFFDEVAEGFDKPVYHLISKKQVRGLAQQPASINSWNSTKGIYGKLKNDEFRQQLKQILENSMNGAEDRSLSKSRKASNSMSRDEYHAMRNRQREVNEIKRSLFDPIQQKIEQDFGKHAKSFILPNRLTKEIIKGETELLPAYKSQLFKKYADDLGLDLSDYLS